VCRKKAKIASTRSLKSPPTGNSMKTGFSTQLISFNQKKVLKNLKKAKRIKR
jgi:hypothetical protein